MCLHHGYVHVHSMYAYVGAVDVPTAATYAYVDMCYAYVDSHSVHAGALYKHVDGTYAQTGAI